MLFALIAHDGKKDEMVEFAIRHREFLRNVEMVGTASTSARIREATGLDIRAFNSGPAGGDVQIANCVLEGQIRAVFFFVESMDVHPHDPDIQTLQRICNITNTPLATNPASGDLMIAGLLALR
ncbi:MAG: methylglyoxal synthase [Fimbriimonadaceae bacterium]|nr:methylglyoxal synthase [Fimbriimonadaceae bacterium]